MKSSKSLVLHPIVGGSMIVHVMAAVASNDISDAVLVVGRDADPVAKAGYVVGVSVETVLQSERRGTGHPILTAKQSIARGDRDVLVALSDVPWSPQRPSRPRANNSQQVPMSW